VTTEPRCPTCGSLVRPGADWCSLCHADLRPVAEAAAVDPVGVDPVVADHAAVEAPPIEVTSAAAATVGASHRGRHARSSVDEHPSGASAADLALAKAGIDSSTVAAMLAADGSKPLSVAAGRIADRQQKVVAIVVGTVGLMAVGFLVLYVLGSFVH